jgi:hypothetical protein
MRCELIATIPVRNGLGECILWDDRSQQVWWTDIHACRLFRYEPETTELRQFELPERLGSFGFIERDARLICAFESGFALFDPLDRSINWLARPELGFSGTRFNDGRVDRLGFHALDRGREPGHVGGRRARRDFVEDDGGAFIGRRNRNRPVRIGADRLQGPERRVARIGM